ncbi:hypothetical protein, partial [Salmonella sp. s51228]|uniref:hypothetical protein n=1 Tax=Salmonella sp. s51228 TaxID=3159652 RepID=UPI003980237D
MLVQFPLDTPPQLFGQQILLLRFAGVLQIAGNWAWMMSKYNNNAIKKIIEIFWYPILLYYDFTAQEK